MFKNYEDYKEVELKINEFGNMIRLELIKSMNRLIDIDELKIREIEIEEKIFNLRRK